MEFLVDPENSGQRLDLFLHAAMPQYSRSRLQSWVKDGRVQVDGVAAKSSMTIRGGQRIQVQPADLPPLHAEPEDLPVTVLYEDQDVIAIDKPAGMVVHAGAGVHSGTVVNALLHRFGQLSSVGGDERPGIVHRLDKETSGVLLVARNDQAHRALAEQFATREVEKIYLTMVHGQMPSKIGEIRTPIARDPVHRTRMTARLGRGRTAQTSYEVLEANDRFSFLRIRIGTGRTHQIRVHLSSIRHAVLGDRLYGAPAVSPGMPESGRFFLHAHRTSFTSPSTGERITVASPLPPELERWKAALFAA